MHQNFPNLWPNINPELNIVSIYAAAKWKGCRNILSCKRASTRHYSTVSRNNPPIYPGAGGLAAVAAEAAEGIAKLRPTVGFSLGFDENVRVC